jgi:hypothetical protein
MKQFYEIIRRFGIVTVTATIAAALMWISVGAAAATDNSGENLLRNSDFKSEAGGVPTAWTVDALPPCGFSFQLHRPSDSNDGSGEFEFDSEEPSESSLAQSLTLTPGWYQFTAEIKTDSVGSQGTAPELFAKSLTLPISTRSHPMGWRSGWRTYELLFKTGPAVREVAVGLALGSWGSPNTGKIQLRNPVLVVAKEPQMSAEIDDPEKYDLQMLADSRFRSSEAKEAFYPAKYPPGTRWSVLAVYLFLVLVAILGWRAVSPPARRDVA